MKTLKDLEKLAVDANPLLSAIIGGAARAVFLGGEGIGFYTTSFNLKEVERYIPRLSAERDIPLDDLYLAFSMLPVNIRDEDFYKSMMKRAGRLLGKRDPDDCHLLALGLKLRCPVWTNDSDFEGLEVKVLSTTELLKRVLGR
ncbi:MAG: PIN domain-containing protein [Thermodesulfovibrionales bacterium]|nr:PIN domain-containing protein [Thermodesulfovibrionales bacterium]